MTLTIQLAAERRDRAGKGVARQTRRAGRIPAVIYGNKEAPVMISLELRAFDKALRTPGFFTHLFELAVDGTKHRVLPRDVQLDPVTDVPVHVDFLRVGAGTTLTVMVPVEFVNQDKSPGLKRGGVLNIVRHEIEMAVPVDDIPEHITVDLSGFDVGASIHINAIALPAGAKPTVDRDFTIATIVAPSGLKSDEAASA
jgi:large subunit ribosomal protein L25